ncbi:hypothetical protein R1sor_019590 [Riccia sorocarpa]|uniref:Uncharacterized protein n=1 Tax=Riccia sorocarpa TaxID=122646 RepID=A0ABD3ID25_9MARC
MGATKGGGKLDRALEEVMGDKYTIQEKDMGVENLAKRHSERRRQGLRGLGVIQGNCTSLIGWIDQALRLGKKDPSYLNITIGFLEMIWKELNSRIFRGTRTRLPIKQLLVNTLTEIENFPTPNKNEQAWSSIQKAREKHSDGFKPGTDDTRSISR